MTKILTPEFKDFYYFFMISNKNEKYVMKGKLTSEEIKKELENTAKLIENFNMLDADLDQFLAESKDESTLQMRLLVVLNYIRDITVPLIKETLLKYKDQLIEIKNYNGHETPTKNFKF